MIIAVKPYEVLILQPLEKNFTWSIFAAVYVQLCLVQMTLIMNTMIMCIVTIIIPFNLQLNVWVVRRLFLNNLSKSIEIA